METLNLYISRARCQPCGQQCRRIPSSKTVLVLPEPKVSSCHEVAVAGSLVSSRSYGAILLPFWRVRSAMPTLLRSRAHALQSARLTRPVLRPFFCAVPLQS